MRSCRLGRPPVLRAAVRSSATSADAAGSEAEQLQRLQARYPGAAFTQQDGHLLCQCTTCTAAGHASKLSPEPAQVSLSGRGGSLGPLLGTHFASKGHAASARRVGAAVLESEYPLLAPGAQASCAVPKVCCCCDPGWYKLSARRRGQMRPRQLSSCSTRQPHLLKRTSQRLHLAWTLAQTT